MARYWYSLADGSETHASTASMALLHWLFRERPKWPLPEQPECFVLYQVGDPVEGPYDRLFLVHVISVIERKYRISPDIPPELFLPEWYADLPENIDHNFVLNALEENNPLVLFYERTCHEILQWLFEAGEFVGLEVDNEQQ